MTTLKLQFSGHIKKVQIRQAGTKTVAEVQICKKVPGKNGEPDAFTWIKATIWEPKDWQASKLVAGAYISGCGDFALRSYTKSDQTKGVSAEVRCSSFDIDMPDERMQAQVGDTAPGPSADAIACALEVEREILKKQNVTKVDTSIDEPPF